MEMTGAAAPVLLYCIASVPPHRPLAVCRRSTWRIRWSGDGINRIVDGENPQPANRFFCCCLVQYSIHPTSPSSAIASSFLLFPSAAHDGYNRPGRYQHPVDRDGSSPSTGPIASSSNNSGGGSARGQGAADLAATAAAAVANRAGRNTPW